MFLRLISENQEQMLQDENKLIKKIINGEQNAFKLLYLKYSDLLFAYILHHIDDDRDAALDIWQDTWVVFVEKVNDFKYRCSIFTWLCAIAKNKIFDYYRNAKNKELFQPIGNLNFDIDAEELDVGSIDVETQVDVITVLASLTNEYRYLLEVRYLENKSVDEISNEIGKSYKATESILSRAREAFRKKIKHVKNLER